MRFGSYTVKEQLGEGGYARVFLAAGQVPRLLESLRSAVRQLGQRQQAAQQGGANEIPPAAGDSQSQSDPGHPNPGPPNPGDQAPGGDGSGRAPDDTPNDDPPAPI